MIFTFYFTFLCHVCPNYPHRGLATATAPSGHQMTIVVSRTVYCLRSSTKTLPGQTMIYCTKCRVILCLLLLISRLWHRQAIFESKGDKLSSSVECRIRIWKSQDTYSPADWMPTHKPTELSRIKLKKTWTQQPVPMMSEHSAHLTSLSFWLSHLALAIYMFVVNFEALAQASDIWI